MMAQKAKLFKDQNTLKCIMHETDPKKIKKLGRDVKNFDEKIWNKNKYNIVYKGNYAKFSQNIYLKKYLLSTKDKTIVEASPYDKVWGIGFSEKNVNINDQTEWGENLLGKILMKVREELK